MTCIDQRKKYQISFIISTKKKYKAAQLFSALVMQEMLVQQISILE